MQYYITGYYTVSRVNAQYRMSHLSLNGRFMAVPVLDLIMIL